MLWHVGTSLNRVTPGDTSFDAPPGAPRETPLDTPCRTKSELRLEMMLRQFYLGFSFFRYGLNWLDFLVVCSSWVELFAAGLPINPTFLRMLRLGKCLGSMRVKWFAHLGNGEASVFLKAGGI